MCLEIKSSWLRMQESNLLSLAYDTSVIYDYPFHSSAMLRTCLTSRPSKCKILNKSNTMSLVMMKMSLVASRGIEPLSRFLKKRALPLSYLTLFAASGATHFLIRGHTPRLNSTFSLQLFFTGLSKGTCPFSMGGFLPPGTLTTVTCRPVFVRRSSRIYLPACPRSLALGYTTFLMGATAHPPQRFTHRINALSVNTRRLPTFS